MPFLLFFVVSYLPAAPEDGRAAFDRACAECHKDPPVNRAPLPDALRRMPRQAILDSMERGSMKQMAASLTPAERAAVADYLTAGQAAPTAASNRCPPGYKPSAMKGDWNGWSNDRENSRFQSTAPDVRKLHLKWAFGFEKSPAAIAQPTLVNGRLYFGSVSGAVYAVDAATGCTHWTFSAEAPVRAAVIVAPDQTVFVADTQANVYALSPSDGSPRWKVKIDEHPAARVTAAPKLEGSRLFVPVSSTEEINGGSPKYSCCSFRGSVVAIDVKSGKLRWKSYTIPDAPQPTRKNSAGTQLLGPAGAAVWVSPAVDRAKGLLYVGTGNAYADPKTAFSDAVLALSMEDGAVKWSRQLTPGDGWNFSCINPAGGNCPQDAGPDVDIGAPPILKTLSDGRRILLVGQKSGIVHALDPDSGGKILWQTRIGEGGALGGVQWGLAADDHHVYAALSDIHRGQKAGGLFALDLATGNKVWHVPPPKPPCAGEKGCTPAQMAPLTVTPSALLAGSMDGVLRAHDPTTGDVVWEFDTNRAFETVNGVKAHGGSISASGPVITGGMMFVNSGYGILGGMPGNVLLAFAP